ncbi:helix-turn-helix transcriptional regulator [Tessaracoccus sp.]|uniref:helix-turn-helix transcriptional regulator n=1 Tax=Tessaracoccus sp. TaxID=1971211 RepID=UPI002618DED5|nr:helix-turn-helix transcriptional regulator [Tessaracoccus sp.]
MHIEIDRRMPATAGVRQQPAAVRWAILAATVGVALLAALNLVREWFAVAVPCAIPDCSPPQLTVAATADLAAQGVPLPVWGTGSVVVSAIATLVPLLLAPFVGSRATRPAALMVPPVLLLTALGPSAAFAPAPWLAVMLSVLAQLALFALLAAYPDGRFQPRWTAVPVVAAAVWAAVTAIPPIPSAVADNEQPWASLYGVGFALALIGVLAGLVVRFVRGDATTRRGILLLAVGLGMFICYGAGFSIYQGIDAENAGIGTLLGSASAQLVNLMLVIIIVLLALGAVRDARHLTGGRPDSVIDGYTPRERQVLALLAEAATTGQIADHLGIAQKTVRNLLSTLYVKLGVEDRGQAVLAAQRLLRR